MQAQENVSPIPQDPKKKLKRIEAELNERFLEREEQIRGLMCALLAEENVLLLGLKGAAKTQLAGALCQALEGARYFKSLLSRFSTPEQLLGPYSIKGFENDAYRRKTAGYLPEADVAFIDEVFKCLAGDTLVTLPNGIRRRIDSFHGADLPALYALEDRRLVCDQAVRFVKKPAEPIYKLTLASGKEIRATANHRFFARSPAKKLHGKWFDWSDPAWIELSLLERGYYVATPTRLAIAGDQSMPDHEVALAALLIADGGCTRPQIRYTKMDAEMVAFAWEQVALAGDELVPLPNRKDYRCRGTNVRAFVKRLGINVPSTVKSLPEQILRLPNHQLARFVGLLWSGDGYINPSNGHITYATSSRNLVADIQHALLRFGVTSDIQQFTTTDGFTDTIRVAYRLRVRQVSASDFVDSFAEHMTGKQAHNVTRIDTSVKVSPRRNRREGDVFWDKVVSIESDGDEPTYCFETSTNNFVANDIVVHNCNSAVLNELLPILEERVFFDDGQEKRIPLKMVVGASNELPHDRQELDALWDRFMVRMDVSYLTDAAFRTLLTSVSSRQAAPAGGALFTRLTSVELASLRSEVAAMDTTAIIEPLIEIRRRLGEARITASDRRYVKSLKLVAAQALMSGKHAAIEEDLSVLASVLWEEPSQARQVRKIIMEIANPALGTALDLMDEAQEIHEKALSAAEEEKTSAGTDANSNLKRIQNRLLGLRTDASTAGRGTERIDASLGRVQAMIKEVLDECLGLSI